MTKVIKKWANPEQQWIFERGAAPTLLCGGINSGKTTGCVLKALSLMIKYPKSRLAIIRRSYSQLLKTTAESWYQWCDPRLYSNGSRKEDVLTLNNGSKAYFIHLDQPNSLDLLAGLELNFVYASQVEEIAEKAWDLSVVRVGRWTGAEIPDSDFAEFGGREFWPWRATETDICVPPMYIFAEGYVTDEGHWCYDRFAPESPNRAKWQALGYESKIVNTESNIYAIKANVDAALAKDEDYIRRYVRPHWGNPEGRIFTIHPSSILEPEPYLIEKLLRRCKLHRSLDHGEFAPTCCLWHATDSEGNIFVFREYYKADALISTHRRMIYELSKDDGFDMDGKFRYYSNVADPSIFNKDRGGSAIKKHDWAVADDYRDSRIMERETAIYWAPANNDEEATRSRLKEYLRIDPNHVHPITREKGAPHLYFIKRNRDYPNGCDQVIRQLRSQMRLKAKSGDREVWLDKRDETITDHAYDTVKYFVVGRPSLGLAEALPEVPPGHIRLADYEKATSMGRQRRSHDQRVAEFKRSGYGVGG